MNVLYSRAGCRVKEWRVGIDHDDVGGVEVFFATETPGEVSFWVGCGVKIRTERAEETEIAFGGFIGDCEDVGNELVNGDVISQMRRMGVRFCREVLSMI